MRRAVYPFATHPLTAQSQIRVPGKEKVNRVGDFWFVLVVSPFPNATIYLMYMVPALVQMVGACMQQMMSNIFVAFLCSVCQRLSKQTHCCEVTTTTVHSSMNVRTVALNLSSW